MLMVEILHVGHHLERDAGLIKPTCNPQRFCEATETVAQLAKISMASDRSPTIFSQVF